MRLASKTFADDKGFSGPEITDFFRQHADDIPDYWELEAVPSRWVLFEDCLKRFPVAKQRQILLELCGWKGPMKWGRPEPDAMATLRRLLSEGIPVDEFETQLTRINAQTVQEDWRKILRRIPQDPDGAITSARSLIESSCKCILDELGVKYDSSDDLVRLYKRAATALHLSPEQQSEQIFKQILGGCVSVVSGVAALRNIYGDAHGKGKKRVRPEARHAYLAVNLAGALSAFLIATYETHRNKQWALGLDFEITSQLVSKVYHVGLFTSGMAHRY